MPEGRTITYKYRLTDIERIINHKPYTKRKRLKRIYTFPLETHELSHRCYAFLEDAHISIKVIPCSLQTQKEQLAFVFFLNKRKENNL